MPRQRAGTSDGLISDHEPLHIFVSGTSMIDVIDDRSLRYVGFGCFSSGNVACANSFAREAWAHFSRGAHFAAREGVLLSLSSSSCFAKRQSSASRTEGSSLASSRSNTASFQLPYSGIIGRSSMTVFGYMDESLTSNHPPNSLSPFPCLTSLVWAQRTNASTIESVSPCSISFVCIVSSSLDRPRTSLKNAATRGSPAFACDFLPFSVHAPGSASMALRKSMCVVRANVGTIVGFALYTLKA